MKYWSVEIERTRVVRERCVVRAETAEAARRCAETDDDDVIQTESLDTAREAARALRCEETTHDAGRRAAIAALVTQFPLDHRCRVREVPSHDRYALVQAFGSKHWIATFASPAASVAHSHVDTSGFEPIHLIDLDTGEPLSMSKRP